MVSLKIFFCKDLNWEELFLAFYWWGIRQWQTHRPTNIWVRRHEIIKWYPFPQYADGFFQPHHSFKVFLDIFFQYAIIFKMVSKISFNEFTSTIRLKNPCVFKWIVFQHCFGISRKLNRDQIVFVMEKTMYIEFSINKGNIVIKFWIEVTGEGPHKSQWFSVVVDHQVFVMSERQFATFSLLTIGTHLRFLNQAFTSTRLLLCKIVKCWTEDVSIVHSMFPHWRSLKILQRGLKLLD